eukprot:2357944-Lingulodinium_polyedra.AAC.1
MRLMTRVKAVTSWGATTEELVLDKAAPFAIMSHSLKRKCPSILGSRNAVHVRSPSGMRVAARALQRDGGPGICHRPVEGALPST